MNKFIFALLINMNALAMHVNLPKAASRLVINKVLSRKLSTNFGNLSREELIQKLMDKSKSSFENMSRDELVKKLKRWRSIFGSTEILVAALFAEYFVLRILA